MEGDLKEEKPSIHADLQTHLLNDNNNHVQKGGLRTMPFIIVNEAFEKVASSGVMANMIFYLMEVYHMEAVTGTSVIYIWSALSDGLSIFGAFVSDSYFGRFRVIAFGSLSSLVGVSLLWLTSIVPQLTPSSASSCPPTPAQLGFLLASFSLISIGSGCIRPCSIVFGADQLKHYNSQRLIDSYFNWYYASSTISYIIASTVVVYIQDLFGWRVGFAVPVLVMLCSALMFLLGSSLYVKVEVKKSPFSGLIQVLAVAFKNRKIRLLPGDCYNHSNEMDRVELTDNLRFLNKACVVRDVNIGSIGSNPCGVPTVEKVESLKTLIRIIPIWSSGILLFTITVQNFPTLQAKKMNRNITSWFEIPAASFILFELLTITIWIPFYDCILDKLLAKYTNEPRGLNLKTRMGIGLILSVITMVVSAIVETIRRDLANQNTPFNMSAMWLVPQYVLLGLSVAFNDIGQIEFYYSELPKSMASFSIAVLKVSAASGSLVASLLTNIVDSVTGRGGNVSWLSSDIDEGHVDYYYWLLSFLSLLNFFYYLICCRVHRSFSSSECRLSHAVNIEGSDSIEDKL
ncbi:putative proton-dependent oligopeptide transporter family, major facilitator superfamily [Helianthus annuus]|uniref:Proton-dependent oligopeptide transporter family, major facilitator superfamily n=1 Tax=Helianthus annuus TaxID=4232 RepID=A0A251VSU7_HELAN|nr:protein NRT1/ PTR FAMILY 1.2 [Helianthus annuus]KAF5823876.1 putative proton-dependent oligopeptide transporter family, major facilitator superfamily [Helianthus annuus]KAJ0624876.1 putative proton-dependent oligopeptide transporter family, MFS transporter superfamily [Helianthus annuus]KAJ0958783.1 putative proton-dependent oligopeptide transporter family, major facilitator superfamily [Helianthus annuus]